MWINVVTGGSSAESIVFHVSNLNLPAGGYELAFSAQPPAGMEVRYAVRSMENPEKIYCTGVMEEDSVKQTFDMEQADEACEIVWFVGGMDSSTITFRDITLFKRS